MCVCVCMCGMCIHHDAHANCRHISSIIMKENKAITKRSWYMTIIHLNMYQSPFHSRFHEKSFSCSTILVKYLFFLHKKSDYTLAAKSQPWIYIVYFTYDLLGAIFAWRWCTDKARGTGATAAGVSRVTPSVPAHAAAHANVEINAETNWEI